jgi:septal ring factor EnvC (AmiA/AmiB activator)
MADPSSHRTTPFTYAAALAVVVLAVAVAYRVAAFRDPVSFGVNREGLDVKVGEAKDQLTSAARQLAELQNQLDAQEKALRMSEADLQAKDAEVRTLVAELASLTQRPDAGPSLRAVAPQIAALQRRTAPQMQPAPAEAEARARLQGDLLSAGRDIETAKNIIQSIGR